MTQFSFNVEVSLPFQMNLLTVRSQYVTPDSKIYCKKVKMCRFSSGNWCSGNWFFCTKFVQLAVAGKRRNTVVHLKKKRNKLDLTAVQYF